MKPLQYIRTTFISRRFLKKGCYNLNLRFQLLDRQDICDLPISDKNSVRKIGEKGGNPVGQFALWVKQKLMIPATYSLPPSETAV